MGKTKRLLCFLVMVVILLTASIPINAAEIKNVNDAKSYDIAVVYDNSGSMYHDKSWCRAKYAMEIFASMLDFGKAKSDKLTIFPMWKVLTDGTTPGIEKEPEGNDLGVGSIKPITIQSVKDIDKITKMYTTQVGDTPLEPIDEACEYLQTSNASEKWLIVLTDGAFTQEKRSESESKDFPPDSLQKKLNEKASADIKIQYLGFGEASEIKESTNLYAATCNDKNLQDNLISICNNIFQRSVLKGKLDGKKLNIELSMKKLIVFAQGENAKISSLKADKTEIDVIQNSGQRKYSTYDMPWWAHDLDKTLAGQVVTFGKCTKGSYTLNYSGADADKIQIFYEPDIDLNVTFSDADGKVIDISKEELMPGDYHIHYNLIDGATGEDITNDEKALQLLGGDVQLGATAKSSIYDNTPIENDAAFELVADDPTTLAVDGSYLGGKYTIHYDIDLSANKPAELPFAVTASVKEDNSWYVLKEHDKWKPIHADFTLDGKKLTPEQMERVNIGAAFEPDLTYNIKMNPNDSSADIYIAKDSEGAYTEPATGDYSARISSLYEDEYGRAQEAEAECVFGIGTMSRTLRFWIIFGIILLALLILAALIWWILTRKILPKQIYTKKDETEFSSNGNQIDANAMYKKISFFDRFSKRGIPITFKTPADSHGTMMTPVTLVLKPISTVKEVLFNKKRAKVQATLRTPPSSFTSVNIAGTEFSYSGEKNSFVNGDDNLCKDVPIKLSNGAMLEFDQNLSSAASKSKLNYTTTVRMKW